MPSQWTSRIECGGHSTSGSVHPHLALSGDYFALCHGLCALAAARCGVCGAVEMPEWITMWRTAGVRGEL